MHCTEHHQLCGQLGACLGTPWCSLPLVRKVHVSSSQSHDPRTPCPPVDYMTIPMPRLLLLLPPFLPQVTNTRFRLRPFPPPPPPPVDYMTMHVYPDNWEVPYSNYQYVIDNFIAVSEPARALSRMNVSATPRRCGHIPLLLRGSVLRVLPTLPIHHMLPCSAPPRPHKTMSPMPEVPNADASPVWL